MAQEAGIVAPLVGHAGDGNFHMLLLVDPADAEELGRARAVAADMISLAHSLGGTCTGGGRPGWLLCIAEHYLATIS